MYMCDPDPTLEDWTGSHSVTADICKYWRYVSSQMTDNSGDRKYTNLAHVAKSALAVSHGNSVPERVFFVNNALMAKDG
jgi:hypothetical protein